MFRTVGLASGLLAMLTAGWAVKANEELTKQHLQELGYSLKALGFITEQPTNGRFNDAALKEGTLDFQSAFGFRPDGVPDLDTFLITNRMNAWRSTDDPVALQHPTCTIFGARDSIDKIFFRAAEVLSWTGSCIGGKASGDGKLRIERHYRLSAGETRTFVDFYQGSMRAGFFDGDGKYFFFNGLSVTGRWEKGRARMLDGQGAPAVTEIHGEALNRVKRALNQMGFKAGAEDAGFDKTAQKALRQFQSAIGIRPDGKLTRDMAIIVYRMQEWRTGSAIKSALFPVGGGSRKCEIYGGRRFTGGGVRLVEMTGSCPDGKPAGRIRLVVQDVVNLPSMKTTHQTYEGELAGGFYHGKGTYAFEDGTVINGRWANGKFLFQNEADPTDIRSIQQLLAENGYNPGPADGLMGGKTRDAIRTFQKDEGLKVDGQPSTALLSQLRSKAVTARAEDREDDDYIEFELEFLLAREGYDPERYPGDPDRQLAAAAQAYRKDWQMPAGTPYDNDIIDMLTQVDARTRPGWQVLEGSRCKAWNDWPHARETLVWSGACPGDKASGDGILKGRFMLNGDWVTHNKYEGVLENGKANGYGARYYLSGRSITGIWKEGQPHGFAVEHSPKGSSYSGGWADGERHGQGTLTHTDGTEIKTEWVNGERVK